MEDTIAALAQKTGLTPEQTDKAVRIVLNFLHRSGPTELIEKLVGKLGAEAYLAPAEPRGFLKSTFGGVFAATGAMAAFSALQAEGLGIEQMQALVKNLIERAGTVLPPEEVEQIVGSVPGLSQLL